MNALGFTRRGILKSMLAAGAAIAVPAFTLGARAARKTVEVVRDRAAELLEMTRWAQEAVDEYGAETKEEVVVLFTPPPNDTLFDRDAWNEYRQELPDLPTWESFEDT